METLTFQAHDAWKSEARRSLEYARRLKYSDPRLCMTIIIDVLDGLLKEKS